MTNSSTVVTALCGLETRSLRSSLAKTIHAHDAGTLALEKLSSGTNDLVRDRSMDEDEALAREEEKLMMHDEDEDEEISSHDEDGNPVVDTARLENRMLTVAIVNSVVENAASKEGPQQHRYGLRKRRRLSEKSDSTAVSSPRTPPSWGSSNTKGSNGPKRASPSGTPRTTRSTVKQTEATNPAKPKEPESTATIQPLAAAVVPIKVESCPVRQACTTTPITQRQRIEPTIVPNPLGHSTPPPIAAKTIKILSEETPTHQNKSVAKPSQNTAPPLVACPLPLVPSTEQRDRAAVTKRGRIFSIDIDPAGLDFPDLGIVDAINQQSELSKTAPLPPITATSGGEGRETVTSSNVPEVKTEPKSSAVVDAIHTNAELLVVGRDRAMSFEFFSFGLNHDEPPPPAPELAAYGDVANRPRGDSIIFDPTESALLRSRGNSIEITALHEDVTLLNEARLRSSSIDHHIIHPDHASNSLANGSYILPSSTLSSSQVTESTSSSIVKSPSSAQMATLPSSLNCNGNIATSNSGNHATFQMELLNKDGRIGIYLPEARKERIAKFHSKRKMRIWRKRIKYDCRKKLADSRPRIKGRFVKRSDMEYEI